MEEGREQQEESVNYKTKQARKKEQTLRLEAQSCEEREDGGCQAGAEPIKWE